MALFESKDEEYAHGVKDGQNTSGLSGMLGDIIPGPEVYNKGWEYGRKHQPSEPSKPSQDSSDYSSSNYDTSSENHYTVRTYENIETTKKTKINQSTFSNRADLILGILWILTKAIFFGAIEGFILSFILLIFFPRGDMELFYISWLICGILSFIIMYNSEKWYL